MDKWFEFGGVRGLIGVVIAALQALILARAAYPSLSLGAQSLILGEGFANINVTTPSVTSLIANQTTSIAMLVAILLGVIFTFVVSGFIYWIGARIVEYAGWDVRDVWKAIASGVIGSLVVGIPIIVIVYSAFMTSVLTLPGAEYFTQAFFASLIASIPLYIIAEVGFATITWVVYKQMGWVTPE